MNSFFYAYSWQKYSDSWTLTATQLIELREEASRAELSGYQVVRFYGPNDPVPQPPKSKSQFRAVACEKPAEAEEYYRRECFHLHHQISSVCFVDFFLF